MSDTEQRPAPPDALLLLATGCPHCGAVLEGPGKLLKEGAIGRLEAVNVALLPERARELGVRSVPWTRIGPYELEGEQSPGELRRWAEGAGTVEGMAQYFYQLLISGRRARVEEMARREPRRLEALAHLLEDPETSMAVRLGIGAVLEELQGSGISEVMIPRLGALTRHQDARIRADACHFLSLIGGSQVLPYLRACLADADREVREIAAEALEQAGEGGAPGA